MSNNHNPLVQTNKCFVLAQSNVGGLLKLHPNPFDRPSSLKGEYDIKIDLSVPSVQHARKKVPIKSKASIEEAIDYMVEQGILETQIETNTMGIIIL